MPHIFIHGLGQTASNWKQTISHLVEPDKALCPDLAPFLQEEASYAKLYQGFSDYCQRSAEPLDLCGLSLGAILALNYAVEHSAQVRSLILIGGQYKMPHALLKLQNIIFRFLPEAAFASTGIRKSALMNLTSSMSELDFSQNLTGISCPVLVICGEKDGANKKAARKMAERIPKAELQFLKNAGHEVNVDAPKELAELLTGFYHRQQL